MTINFRYWRRDLEQAIARGESIPIRVLLDEAERAFEELEAAADRLAAAFDGDPSADVPGP